MVETELKILDKLRSMNHENLVKVIDFFDDQHVYYIVMEKCKFFSL